MIKKAAIIVAASAAALVAATPLAFAHSAGYDHSPACSFSADNDNSVDQGGTGFVALIAGAAGLVTNSGIPANAQTQAPVASCNNVEDVLNTTTADNFQDNSSTETTDVTKIVDSGNRH